jgi:hypothetical protein
MVMTRTTTARHFAGALVLACVVALVCLATSVAALYDEQAGQNDWSGHSASDRAGCDDECELTQQLLFSTAGMCLTSAA